MYTLNAHDGKHVHVAHSEKRFNSKFLATTEAEASELVAKLNLPDTLAALAKYRFEKETGGVTLGEMEVRTDRESQSQLNSAFITLKEGFVTSTPWKKANGWQDVTLATITPLAQGVAQHVNKCFIVEQTVEEQLHLIVSHTEMQAVNVQQLFDDLFDV
jgi:hypothetical protein